MAKRTKNWLKFLPFFTGLVQVSTTKIVRNAGIFGDYLLEENGSIVTLVRSQQYG